jgi:uncharacterized protein (UPF0218 family)
MINFQGYTHKSTVGTLLRGLTLTALAATLGVALPALAANKGAAHAPMADSHAASPRSKMSPAQKKQFEAFQKARSEMMQARGRLSKIQKAAFKAHPELLKQQKSFGDLLSKTMKKNGYDSRKEIAELKSLRSRLQDKKTPQAKKQKLAHQFQAKVIKLNKARGKALQDKKVRKAQQSLQNAVISAMRKQDPDTNKLIAMLQSKQQELLKIRQALLKQMQQSKNKEHAAAKTK